MNGKITQLLEKYNSQVIIFDIDGTLKDLCKEHNSALRLTLEQFNVGKSRRKIILAINRLAMFAVKTGLIPTNRSKQNILVKFLAVLSGVKRADFYARYFTNYTNQFCLFDGVVELLTTLNTEKEVYFATINKQNYNLELCGISQNRIMYTEETFKVTTYNNLLQSISVPYEEVLIIGDNLFDDWFSARRLGIKCLLVNQYNNKLKNLICNFANSKHLK